MIHMATILTSAQKEVIRKIIYAVETGGQKYGDQDYSSLIGAGHNTSNEKAITIFLPFFAVIRVPDRDCLCSPIK